MNPPSSMIALDQDLPDRIIFQSLIQFMEKRDVNWSIYPNDRDNLIIPPNTSLEVITKTFLKEYRNLDFGSGYRVLVAIGDVKQQPYGELAAHYCFATMYFNLQRDLITIDFHKELS